MNPTDFIRKQVVAELVKQGASPGTAQIAADYAAQQYRTTTALTKDPFAELIRLAGMMAMKNQTDFRFVMPRGSK